LANIDNTKPKIFSKAFIFQGSKYYIRLFKKDGTINYDCHLESVETLIKPGKIHFRFDLVKRRGNKVEKYLQHQRELKELHRGMRQRRFSDSIEFIDSTTIRDRILKVKLWTSDYDYELDLKQLNIRRKSVILNDFRIGESNMRVILKKNKEEKKYDIFSMNVDYSLSGKVYFQVDLFTRLDNRLVKSDKFECSFIHNIVDCRITDWFDVMSIRSHIIKVKMLIKPFTDFVDKPAGFESINQTESSDLSFEVNGEVVYVLQDILTSRCDYFRSMLAGQHFSEAILPLSVDSKIPIHDIDVDVFKMIVEWIYTMDIQRLNNDQYSLTLLIDLENVYVAADMYLLPDLCNSIRNYLSYLVTASIPGMGMVIHLLESCGYEL
jgi:hypothetical protein